MKKFTTHSGVAAPLMRDNIDTDAIIPSREMKAVSKHGLAEGLFAGWRYQTPGQRDINPGFVLNRPDFENASILLSGDNFGCGSSREHAVWALKEYGIRAVIAAGFGTIFFNNCIANGLLPVVLSESQVGHLAAIVEQDPARHLITIDLERMTIDADDAHYAFELDEGARNMLLNGLDPIGMTLLHKEAINKFEGQDRLRRPWAYPDRPG